MKPPIRVSVKTDNLSKCTIRIEGAARDADGNPECASIEIGTNGNVYQGLHALRPHLEHAFNGLLASHGIHPDPEPEPTDVQEPAPQTEPSLPPVVAASPPPPPAPEPARAPAPALAVVPPPAAHDDAPKATGIFAPPPAPAAPEPAPVHTGEQTVKLGS